MSEPEALTRARHQPTFTLTFDTELIWGSFDHTPPERFERSYPDIRGTIEAIVRLLDRYEVSATWAVVGHLYLSSCERDASGLAHPELVRPQQTWRAGDWYGADPCTDVERDPLWYGPDVLDLLQAAAGPQEIGCHSFAHALFGDPAMSREAAVSDLTACLRLARERGIELRSMVFPRNSVGWLDVLSELGFTSFRSADPSPFAGRPDVIRRVGHFSQHVLGSGAPTSLPREALPGLWDVAGSTLLIHRAGMRRSISRVARARRARVALSRVRGQGGVFHLWTHPFNLANDRPYMLGVLEDVLVEAVRARDAGDLVIETMGAISDRLAAAARGDAAVAADQPAPLLASSPS
jgi:peptidoglycan/xylan/chitin deacetylase (PgdA/CDA1 family)